MVGESWTWEEDKAFEDALAAHYDTCSDWWEKIAVALPGKLLEEIKNHYAILVEDVGSIESGRVPVPSYSSSSCSFSPAAEGSADAGGSGKKGSHSHGDSGHGGKGSRSDHERRKGIAWSEEEHRLFLLGLDKYGKGDWRSISRNFVVSRTPTQVASHAQKYFIRLNSMNKDRRRSSIHDITSISSGDSSVPQMPITGQGGNAAAGSSKSNKLQSPPPVATGISIYGSTTMGQPVGGPLVPAVGTPVGGPPLGYGVRPAVLVTGAPVALATMGYALQNASAQR
ncbi:Transcription factor DIVARICATA [Apostasia shenzhenica]|uniref:Transcription factor MYBS1 n=1 Tax=Apostasia shenzhenica TaxID=1088818 RepID=A0A2I0BF76_9ASPA|nr:Transcription factor DIVARICATA [Apostasia shenzhenica]